MPTVLVVDDFSNDRLLAGGLFEKQPDWTVRYASDGKEALFAIEQQMPDVVVTDMVMPEMGGRELAQEVAARQEDIRVLYMSGYASSDVARDLVDSGMDLIEKPFQPRALLRRVAEALDRGAEHAEEA